MLTIRYLFLWYSASAMAKEASRGNYCFMPVKQDLFFALTLNNSKLNSERQNLNRCVFFCVYNNLKKYICNFTTCQVYGKIKSYYFLSNSEQFYSFEIVQLTK